VRTPEQERERNRRESWRASYTSGAYRRNRVQAIANTAGRCARCGRTVFVLTDGKWVKASSSFGGVHHIKPLSQGGDDSVSNLVVLCRDCHAEMHSG
jgi:5-methylcytosine-specific restriction protein A